PHRLELLPESGILFAQNRRKLAVHMIEIELIPSGIDREGREVGPGLAIGRDDLFRGLPLPLQSARIRGREANSGACEILAGQLCLSPAEFRKRIVDLTRAR